MCDRIIALVDMDCFYCQVETRLNPSLKGKPVAVVQYNQWQGGGIIAVNYEARAFGVTRHIRGNEAKKKCPNINLVHVPSVRGKADLTRYRDAGREVVDVLCRFCTTVERASVDEAYLDLTEAVNSRCKGLNGNQVKLEDLTTTFIVGYSSEDSNDEETRERGLSSWLGDVYESELKDDVAEKLAVAAVLVEEMRVAVYESTGFRCSAGIAHNKILAKLACGLHKPQRQTVLPSCGVPILYRTLPIKKVRGLGGKFGDLVAKKLGVTYMGELEQFSESQLQKAFDSKSSQWLYNIARGYDDEPVTARLKSKSIGCCKKFPGKLALTTKEIVQHWINELAAEIAERLEKELTEGGRRASQIVVSYMQTLNGQDVSSSRCGPLASHTPQQLVTDAMELLKRSNTAPPESPLWSPPLKFLGLSVGKFTEKSVGTSTIEKFFKAEQKKSKSPLVENISHGEQESEEVNNTSHVRKALNSCDSLANEKHVKTETVNSSNKKSFFMNFFKEEGLVKTPKSQRRKRLTPESKSKPTGLSQTASTSGIKPDKTLKEVLSVEDSSNDYKSTPEFLVSPGEIFPDLDNIDDAVAALLPSPMQRQLHERVEKHKKVKEELSSIHKNKGKGKSKKSLTFGTAGMIEQKTSVLAPEEVISKSDNHVSSEIITEEHILHPKIVPENSFARSSPPECKNSCNEICPDTKAAGAEECPMETTTCDDTDGPPEEVVNSDLVNVESDLIKDVPHNFNEIIPEVSDGNNFNNDLVEDIIEQCPHCQQLIPLQDYPEHLDFHVAADLDLYLNKSDSQETSSHNRNTLLSPSTSPKKRKRGKQNSKQSNSIADKKMRSITTFFSRVQ